MRLDLAPDLHSSRATQMNSYANASQQQSFNEQLSQGAHAFHALASSLPLNTCLSLRSSTCRHKAACCGRHGASRSAKKGSTRTRKKCDSASARFSCSSSRGWSERPSTSSVRYLPCCKKIRATPALHMLALLSNLAHFVIFPYMLSMCIT